MWKREHCEPAALETSADNAPAAHETEALMGALERQKDLVLSAPPRVDDGEVAYTPVDAACGSNPRHEDGLRPDDHWMQKYAHLAWLFGGAAIPLTLLTQSTGTATADAGRIHHA
jgi:hypothetical protein